MYTNNICMCIYSCIIHMGLHLSCTSLHPSVCYLPNLQQPNKVLGGGVWSS